MKRYAHNSTSHRARHQSRARQEAAVHQCGTLQQTSAQLSILGAPRCQRGSRGIFRHTPARVSGRFLTGAALNESAHPTSRTPHRGGFTLVEMLVSIALVLLIMSLFAQAFSIAASAIRQRRGIAETDQRVRSMVTILLGDLQKRTYRQREDAITETIPLPADLDSPTDPRIFLNRLENKANRLGLGIVPLHPDYFIGGGGSTIVSGQAEETWTNGAARRNVDSVYERGYFYLSEGDTANDVDDILKFTIDVSQTDLGNEDTTKLLGRAVALGQTQDPHHLGANPPDPPPVIGEPDLLDQPIWDDGIGQKELPNGQSRSYRPGESGSTTSNLAEISYFVRDGTLYRRVHLIRQPLGVEAEDDQTAQPRNDDNPPAPFPTFADPTAGTPVIYRRDAVGFGGIDFWQDFDHGATRFEDNSAVGSQLHMYDEAMLDNTIGGDLTGGSYPFDPPNRYWALGDPRNRFGHDAWFYQRRSNNNPPLTGRPKSYTDPTDPTTFIGLYTHEETSHQDFDFPGRPTFNGGNVSPMQYGAVVPLATFDNGPRAGEDILLSNCHGFDVKVWDEQLGRFVDMGHDVTTAPPPNDYPGDWSNDAVIDNSLPPLPFDASQSVGRYQAPHWPVNIGMIRYGGRTPNLQPNPPLMQNRVFDTWHPAFNFSANTKDGPPGPTNTVERPDDDPPPHRPLWSDRQNFRDENQSFYDIHNVGDLGATPLPGNPSGIRYWQPDFDYQPGDRVFPRPNIINNGNDPMPAHQSFFYQLDLSQSKDVGDGSGPGPQDGAYRSHATEQPQWPEAPGARTPPQTHGTTGDVTVWKAVNNTIGLKAIQISVRFFDPTSGQMRQMTLTHSFVEL